MKFILILTLTLNTLSIQLQYDFSLLKDSDHNTLNYFAQYLYYTIKTFDADYLEENTHSLKDANEYSQIAYANLKTADIIRSNITNKVMHNLIEQINSLLYQIGIHGERIINDDIRQQLAKLYIDYYNEILIPLNISEDITFGQDTYRRLPKPIITIEKLIY